MPSKSTLIATAPSRLRKPLPSPPSTPPDRSRATVKDFVNAQTNGITNGGQIPNNPPGVTFDRNGAPYHVAIDEIFKGEKTKDWMWYVFPSDTDVSSTTATFFRLGPKAQSETGTLGQTTITVGMYLEHETLLQNYVLIVGALYGSMKELYEKLKSSKSSKPYNEILFDIFGKTDYPKLQSSIQNFYTPLKERLFTNSQDKSRKPRPDYDSDYIEPMKQMNKLNIILNGIEDTDLEINEISDDTLLTSSLMSSIRDPKLSGATTEAPTSSKKNESQIWSLRDILNFIIKNIQDSVFVINGGSFNPPHNGHVKMFDLAYQQLSSMPGNAGKKMYGIMVVAPDSQLAGKGLSDKQRISEQDRIKLCKLACDGYKWSLEGAFDASNMIILNVADNNPINAIIGEIGKLQSVYNGKLSELISTNLLYLGGSDFFIKAYDRNSDYSIIYVVRQGDEEEIKKKYISNDFLQIEIKLDPTSSSDEYDLSSTKIRKLIENLKNVDLNDPVELAIATTKIETSIGLGVYCFLKNIPYLVDKQYYGNLCNDNAADKEALEKASEDIRDVQGIELQKSFRGPTVKKSIFSDIENVNVFNDQTDELDLHKYFREMIQCGSDNIDPQIYDKITDIFNNYYQKGFYRFLNDLYYFTTIKPKQTDPTKCFIQQLFGDQNLLKDMEIIHKDKEADYIARYLTKTNKDIFIDKLKDVQTKKNVEKILGFLYDTQRYTIYLFLINTKNGTQDATNILLKLYGSVSNATIDKMTTAFTDLSKSLSIPQAVSGDRGLLQAINYTFQRSNGDGNCFYNSIGMLSSMYVVSKANFEYYKMQTYQKQNEIQYAQQIRVRRNLTSFFKNIYDIIQVIVGTPKFTQYYSNEIIRYILYNGYYNQFKYVSFERESVTNEYYGTEIELKLSSLLFGQPIVAITGIQGVIGYEVSYWDNYNIPIDGGDVDSVLEFLSSEFSEEIYYIGDSNSMQKFGKFLGDHPKTYFLIGGRGHWSYGINEGLLPSSEQTVGTSVSSPPTSPRRSSASPSKSSGIFSTVASGVGNVLGAVFRGGGSKGDNKINKKITRKNIKNKTNKKKSNSNLTAIGKKTKKLVKNNNNNKDKKNNNSKKTRKNKW